MLLLRPWIRRQPHRRTGYEILGFAQFRLYTQPGDIPRPPPITKTPVGEEIPLARKWVEDFRRVTIPREVVKLSFARSSGPGGQNVNKVNTKCTIRCSASASWIPQWARGSIRKSTSYVASSDEILITSTTTRSQSQNVDDCLAKLHKLVLDSSASEIKNETTEEQKQKVRKLEKAQKERNRKEKDYRSSVKKMRSRKGFGE